MTVPRWLLLLVLVIGSGGCAGDPSDERAPSGAVAADCSVLVRYEGRVYLSGTAAAGGSAAWPELPGEVEVSDCDDTGRDARGAYFPDHPDTHPAVALPGVDPRIAVGYRVENAERTFVVVATVEGLDDAERDDLWARFAR